MHLLPVNAAQKKKIHLLEVIGNANVGGMENYIRNFLTYLPADTFEVSCICPYESPFTESLRQLGVKHVFVTPIEDDPSWSSIQLTIQVARLHNIDLLHAHMPKAHVLAGIAGNFTNKPVVATVHGMDLTAHELGIARTINSHLITNCQDAYIQALALGIPASHADIVRNGIDVNIFSGEHSADKFRIENNVPLNVKLVGFAGRLDFEKGPDFFLYAAEYIHHHNPDVHFVMIGEGSMKKELLAMRTRFELQNHVHFADWQENMEYVYPALDVLAHTSRSDGTSLVLLEAMACKCAVAGFSVGGVREIIESRSTGLLAGAGDCESLGRRIIQLLEEKTEHLNLMGEAARQRVIKYFNVETNTLRVAEVLQIVATKNLNEQHINTDDMIAQKKTGKISNSTKQKAG